MSADDDYVARLSRAFPFDMRPAREDQRGESCLRWVRCTCSPGCQTTGLLYSPHGVDRWLPADVHGDGPYEDTGLEYVYAAERLGRLPVLATLLGYPWGSLNGAVIARQLAAYGLFAGSPAAVDFFERMEVEDAERLRRSVCAADPRELAAALVLLGSAWKEHGG